MSGLSCWPDDNGQVTGQGSLSSDQPGYLMIDPPDCKSLPALNSKLLSRRRGVVFQAFRPPCDQPSTSIMPHSCSPKPMNSVHRYLPIHYLRSVLPTRNFPSPYKTHSTRIPACGSAQRIFSSPARLYDFFPLLAPYRSRAAELKMLCTMPSSELCRMFYPCPQPHP